MEKEKQIEIEKIMADFAKAIEAESSNVRYVTDVMEGFLDIAVGSFRYLTRDTRRELVAASRSQNVRRMMERHLPEFEKAEEEVTKALAGYLTAPLAKGEFSDKE